MFHKSYNNFVRASSPTERNVLLPSLNGDEARRLYLEEVQNAKLELRPGNTKCAHENHINCKRKSKVEEIDVSDRTLFLCVQNNDVDALRVILNANPDKIVAKDDYGWSLLMIACQANSIDTAKELLKRGIDTSIRDKAGNSAQSLVIKNKNFLLANILINHSYKTQSRQDTIQCKNEKRDEKYMCKVCNKSFPDKQEHLSSTIHNINASKGKKILTNYVIPQTNKGYQIMLKVGWDRETGLGPEGTGKKYPIKAVIKKDKKGLGHGKRKEEESLHTEPVTRVNKRKLLKNYQDSRQMEINFRRQFY